MDIIKEYHNNFNGEKTFVLRMNSYGHSLALFDELYAEAQKDFPELEREDVRIVQYGGIPYKHTFGIEFKIDTWITAPDGYAKIEQLEEVLK